MKKVVQCFFTSLLLIICMQLSTSCDGPIPESDVIAVAGVSLGKASLELTEGDEITLTVTINPANATNKNVAWNSSDSSVASVSDGRVTAIKAGSATITVTTEDGGKTATCQVKVVEKDNDDDDNTVGGGGNEGVEFEDWN